MHSLVLPGFELTASQDRGACEASYMNEDDNNQTRESNCKPPKNSFIDYSTFFSPKSFLPAYTPSASAFQPHEQFRAHSPVYQEIHVPPDSLA
jgi:hypothetical protein